ncbi:cytochrome P450 4F4-like [Branchiostoma floridae]|uniref:Cytochrome P450 4F4-like n=1 Tax=Branchiostoma floridae TaxID=7739 RepID=A0A9J7LML1_BRAFL|nr:cytochrome P450 4F4-like [Branchiostoma floridae]
MSLTDWYCLLAFGKTETARETGTRYRKTETEEGRQRQGVTARQRQVVTTRQRQVVTGHDTTASGISWSLYCLAKHPGHQDRVREEVDMVLAGKDDEELTWQDISKLKYLAMCVKEAMRLYPPVPIVSRRITRDFVFMGHPLPTGATININAWCVHHNPTVWGEDFMNYKPERFSSENMKNMDPYAFIPFSAGPRLART